MSWKPLKLGWLTVVFVISLSLLLDVDLEWLPERVVAGVKNLVNRRGVMKGGFRCLVLVLVLVLALTEGAAREDDGGAMYASCEEGNDPSPDMVTNSPIGCRFNSKLEY
jgi:hypothetical protein